MNVIQGSEVLKQKTLIVYSTKTGINSDAAHAMAEVLETKYDMDVTIADLKDGYPDVTPFQNVVVGGGVDRNSVYDEAVDFLGKDFEGKNVALYFSCEDYETPKEQRTEENSKKVLAKNSSLKPIDVAAFGGCVMKQGKPAMDDLNVKRVNDWAMAVGSKFTAQAQMSEVALKTPEPIPEMPSETFGSFEIHCDATGKFRFHLKAANGEIIAQSQAYGAKESALKGIASIKKNAPIAKIVDLTTTST
jgi:uncharacterized protein YegP (UPF0339 family)/menaquinone-dependent protoporphyrinogen IX oxidase